MPTEPRVDLDAPIQTDAASYAMVSSGSTSSAEVGFVLTNRSDEVLNLPNCNGRLRIEVERRTETGWTVAARPATPECESPAIAVLPGGSVSDRVELTHYLPTSSYCCGFVDGTGPPGTFRLRVLRSAASADPDAEDPVRYDLLVSNRFRLE